MLPDENLRVLLSMVHDVSHLESFGLSNSRYPPPESPTDMPIPFLDKFLIAPKLRCVQLDDVDLELNLPWAQLVSFKYLYQSPRVLDYLAAIPFCSPNLGQFIIRPNLKSLFDLQTITPLDFSSRSTYVHREMKELVTNKDIFLHRLTLPNVRALVVTPRNPTPGLLGSLLQRSRCHSLHTLFAIVLSRDIPVIFENTSTVTDLTLIVCYRTIDPLRSLASDKNLLPRMRFLEIKIIDNPCNYHSNDDLHVAGATATAEILHAFVVRWRLLKARLTIMGCTSNIPREKWSQVGAIALLQRLKDEKGLNLQLELCGRCPGSPLHNEYLLDAHNL